MQQTNNAVLSGKTVVITGGNSGIGRSIAEVVIAQGGKAVILGKNAQAIQEVSAELGDRAFGHVCDVSCVDQLNSAFDKIKQDVKHVDGVVVNAGKIILGPADQVTEASFEESVAVNFKGAFFTAQKAIGLMEKGGSIVFIASSAARRAFANGSVYSATKAAIISLAASMALEWAPKKIRVNSISPGIVSTPIFSKLGLSEEQQQAIMDFYLPNVPLGRAANSEEIAEIAAFLLSDASSYVNGENITADGGLAGCLS